METLKSFLQTALGDEGYAFLSSLAWALWPIVNERSFHWVFVLSTVVAAVAFYVLMVRRRGAGAGALAYLLPRSVFAHPSALLDYRYFVVNQLAMAHLKVGGWVTALVGVVNLSQWVPAALATVLGPALAKPVTTAAAVAFSVSLVLATDLARFLAHFWMHRSRALWEFHKVHHSAEVLTPITAFRAHPVEIVLDLVLRTLLGALVVGLFSYVYRDGLVELTIMNFGAISFFYLLTNHLRHSHIPLGYGRHLSQWLVSPVMHQLHHSADPRHFDRNFGFIFTFWDRLTRTHLVPAAQETYRLGLPPDAGRFDTLWALYVLPAARCLGWRDKAPALSVDRARS